MGALPLADATKCTGELLVLPDEGELTETPAKAAAVIKKHKVVRRNQDLVAICIIYSTPGDCFGTYSPRHFPGRRVETSGEPALIQPFFQSCWKNQKSSITAGLRPLCSHHKAQERL